MDKMKNVPEIRFKGYEGEWTTCTLNSFTERIVRKNTNNECSLPLTISAQYGLIDQNEFFNSRIASKDVSRYYLVRKGEFAYNKSTSDGYPFGVVKRLDKYPNGVLSTLYIVFNVNEEKVDSDFLTVYFDTNNWHGHISSCAAEGARNHGLLNISSDDFFKLGVSMPKKESEQKKISKIITTLDSLISKLEQKLEKLRNIKQSLLNQMFVNVNRGGYAPLIRFKNQTYHWNEMSAEEIFHTYYDKNHPDLPVVSASQEYGMVFRDDVGFDVQHDKANEVGYKRVLPGQFVIHLRSFQGGFAYSEVEGITSPAYTIIEFKDKSQNDGLYWKYVLSSKEFIKRLETVTYGIRDGRSISFEDFAELKFMVPQKEEQKQIGKLLLIADCNSRKVENKITKLRTMKQSLLQKMFV